MNARRSAPERGSIMLFVLFICLAVAVLVQTLSVMVICAHRGADAEDQGRLLMGQKVEALAEVRQELLAAWGPRGPGASQTSPEVVTAVADIPDSGDRALQATASHPAVVSPIVVSAWVERGRDGLDLPLAGLVAEQATWAVGRASPWLELEDPTAAGSDGGEVDRLATGRLCVAPESPPLGPGVAVGSLPAPWRLDPGWLGMFEATGPAKASADGVAPGTSASAIAGQEGATVALPSGYGATAGEPALVVVTGGASLDATGRGDFYGVLVVDDGGVSLEGTRLHGAVFATDTVAFGTSGEVLFSPTILRWATDGSLTRTRMVPGSRRESLQ